MFRIMSKSLIILQIVNYNVLDIHVHKVGKLYIKSLILYSVQEINVAHCILYMISSMLYSVHDIINVVLKDLLWGGFNILSLKTFEPILKQTFFRYNLKLTQILESDWSYFLSPLWIFFIQVWSFYINLIFT